MPTTLYAKEKKVDETHVSKLTQVYQTSHRRTIPTNPHEVQAWQNHLVHIGLLQAKQSELAITICHFPEQHQQLLIKPNLFCCSAKKCADTFVGVIQQTSDTTKQKLKILRSIQ